jgi:AcrR family transcriptional regulator
MMAKRSKTQAGQGLKTVDQPAVLQRVMDVLSLKGFGRVSITDLTQAAGTNPRTLHETFGTRNDILRAAIRFCAGTEASLAHEPLHTSPTGKEAIWAMLEENVRLRRHCPWSYGCLFTLNAFVIPPEETALQNFLAERRGSLAKQIRARLTRSVDEGELPEGTNVGTLASLCFTMLSGLTFRVLDGAPVGLLFRSIELFVNALGFQSRRRQAGASAGKSLRPRRAVTR